MLSKPSLFPPSYHFQPLFSLPAASYLSLSPLPLISREASEHEMKRTEELEERSSNERGHEKRGDEETKGWAASDPYRR